jgi:RNA polymerase sigma factor (sigma-70 family)
MQATLSKPTPTEPRLTDEQRQLVADNLGLTFAVAHKLWPCWYMRAFESVDEAAQAGIVGLARAVMRFDPVRARLSTYAWFYIRAAIQDEARRLGRNPNKEASYESQLGDADRLIDDRPPQPRNPMAISQETRELLLELDERSRVVIVGIHFRCKSYADLAGEPSSASIRFTTKHFGTCGGTPKSSPLDASRLTLRRF